MRAADGQWPLAATLVGVLLLGGCETPMQVGSPAAQASCARTIAEFGKARPGFMNVEEWGAYRWRGFAGIFDANHDGKVTFEELTARKATYPPNVSTANRKRMEKMEHDWQLRSFRAMDHGKKGYIDQHDIMLDNASDFRAHDLNHDGWLTPYECAITPPRTPELI